MDYSYSTINTAKSAVLSFVTCEDKETNLHDNPDINRFMRGIYNLKPPTPKYAFTWDVNTVLDLLKSWFPHENLELKKLTLKTVCLITLISGQRAQSIHNMDLEFCSNSNDSFIFSLPNVMKNMKPGMSKCMIRVHEYTEEEICPLRTLKVYISKTRNLRSNSKLWIGFRKPHKPIGRQTISRWLNCVLQEAGIDMNTFTAHSTRMASTSKAAAAGIGLDAILKTAGWSSAKNFERFYCRQIEDTIDSAEFASGVLSNKR